MQHLAGNITSEQTPTKIAHYNNVPTTPGDNLSNKEINQSTTGGVKLLENLHLLETSVKKTICLLTNSIIYFHRPLPHRRCHLFPWRRITRNNQRFRNSRSHIFNLSNSRIRFHNTFEVFIHNASNILLSQWCYFVTYRLAITCNHNMNIGIWTFWGLTKNNLRRRVTDTRSINDVSFKACPQSNDHSYLIPQI